MYLSNLKKTLLAGTALVAVGACMPLAISQAQAADLTLTGTSPWALSGGVGGAQNANAGDNVDVDTYQLTITNNNLDDDGSGVGTFNIGDVTDSDTGGPGTGGVLVFSAGGFDATVTIGSISVANDLTVQNNDAHDVSNTVTVLGNVTTGGQIQLINYEVDQVDSMLLTINGDVVADQIRVQVVDDMVAHDAILTFGGDNVTATNGFVLNNLAAGSVATLVFDNIAGTQTVNGNVGTQSAGDGLVQVTATGTTFTGNLGFSTGNPLGRIEVGNAGNTGILVTFEGNVFTDTGLHLGNNAGGETMAVTIGGPTDTVIDGGLIAEVSEFTNVTISGGNTVTQQNGAWTGIDNLTFANSSTLVSQDDIEAGAISITVGSTLNIDHTSATAIVGNVSVQGTLVVSAAATIDGDVLGLTGLLDIDKNTTVTERIDVGAIDVAAGVTLQVLGTSGNGTVKADTTLHAGSTLQMSSDETFAGNLLSDSQGNGRLHIVDGNVVTASFIITGNVGTSTNHVGEIEIEDHSDIVILNVDGDLFVDAITLGQNDELRFIGGVLVSDTQTVSGTISATTAGANITIGNGGGQDPIVIFNGAVGGSGNLNNFTVKTGSTAIFNANAIFSTGLLTADQATIQVAEGVTLSLNSYANGDVTTWNIGVNNTGGTQTHGTVGFTAPVTLDNDNVHFIVSAGSDPLIDGSVLDNVFTGNAQNIIGNATVTDNSFFYDFELVDDVNNIDVTIVQAVVLSEIAETTNNATIGEVLLNELSGITNTEINQIQANLGAASNAKELNDILEASGPTVDGGAVAGAMAMANGALNITKKRLASRRTDSQSGVATGNLSEGTQVWVQAYGASGSQNRRGGIDGFDINGHGLAFGIDTENLSVDTVVGLAFSYGNSNVDSYNANNTNTNIKSYQLTLYGDHDIDESTYISARLAYAWNDIDTTRFNVGGIAGLNARGDYDANQFSARAEIGRSYDYDGTIVTPSLMANYVSFSPDSYTETGAGGANLSIAANDVEIFELGVGVDISRDYQQADGSIVTPALHLAYRHDVIGDTAVMNSSFAAGGSTFRAVGFSPAQDTLDIGVSVTYAQANNWQLTANYNFEYKSDYEAHSGSVRAAYKF